MVDLVYICSSARSGSTLLDLLIGAHPSALPVSEINRLPEHILMDSRCTCGEPISRCGFWVPIVDELAKVKGADLWRSPRAVNLGFTKPDPEMQRSAWLPLYLAHRALYIGWLDLLQYVGVDIHTSSLCSRYQRWIVENGRLHDIVRCHSGCRLIVDSSKDVKVAVGLYRARPDHTRIILLSRDGRGVMASTLRTASDLNRSVKGWVRYYRRALRWLTGEVDQRHVLRVRYENLVANPDAEMRRVFQFLELDKPDGADHLQPSHAHVFSGNRNTLKTSSIKPDERWRTELSEEHLAFFERHGAATMLALGYPYARHC